MLRNRKGMLKGMSPFKHDDGTKHGHGMKMEKLRGKISKLHTEPVSDMPAVTVTPEMETKRNIKKKLKKFASDANKFVTKKLTGGSKHPFGGVRTR